MADIELCFRCHGSIPAGSRVWGTRRFPICAECAKTVHGDDDLPLDENVALYRLGRRKAWADETVQCGGLLAIIGSVGMFIGAVGILASLHWSWAVCEVLLLLGGFVFLRAEGRWWKDRWWIGTAICLSLACSLVEGAGGFATGSPPKERPVGGDSLFPDENPKRRGYEEWRGKWDAAILSWNGGKLIAVVGFAMMAWSYRRLREVEKLRNAVLKRIEEREAEEKVESCEWTGTPEK